MTGIPVFYCERSGRERLSLRRYADGPCVGSGFSFHNARVVIGEQLDDGSASGDLHPHDDPRWPTSCEHCGRAFEEADHWQLFREDIYARPGTGEEFTLREAPAGACWNADWMTEGRKPGSGFHIGDDGRCLFVRLPPDRHDWCIDARSAELHHAR